MVSIISVLSGAVVILWRNHLAADERERKRTAALESELRAIVSELRNALRKGTPK